MSFPKAGQPVTGRFCSSCGSRLEKATVSVAEVIQYLRTDSYLSVRAAAEYLGLSARSLQRLRSEIPHYRPGGKILFKRSDLDRWMELYRQEPITQKDLKTLVDAVVRKVRGNQVKHVRSPTIKAK